MHDRVEKCVLVVDDEMVIADSLAIILNENGYSAHAAYSGESALELAASLSPDILISDVVMGEMSGIELAIYFTKAYPDCRIVLISGHAITRDLLEWAAKSGYRFELIPKPAHPQELLDYLASITSEMPDFDHEER
jgi:DNA-binding NtrC family response regulator